MDWILPRTLVGHMEIRIKIAWSILHMFITGRCRLCYNLPTFFNNPAAVRLSLAQTPVWQLIRMILARQVEPKWFEV